MIPTLKVVKIQPMRILAGSLPINNEDATQKGMARQSRFSSLEDEEE